MRPCFICGHGIASDDFLEWPDTPGAKFAICGHCGVPNEEQDAAFVVERSPVAAVPAAVTDVSALASGGWRACCDCGLTHAATTQADAWAWLLDHRCVRLLEPTT